MGLLQVAAISSSQTMTLLFLVSGLLHCIHVHDCASRMLGAWLWVRDKKFQFVRYDGVYVLWCQHACTHQNRFPQSQVLNLFCRTEGPLPYLTPKQKCFVRLSEQSKAILKHYLIQIQTRSKRQRSIDNTRGASLLMHTHAHALCRSVLSSSLC